MTTPILTVGYEDRDLARKIQGSFARLYENPPADYQFSLTDARSRFSPASQDGITVVAGELDSLLGYACCKKVPAGPDVGRMSQLVAFQLDFRYMFDTDRELVTRETLSRYPGYSDYSHSGPLLYVSLLDIFQQRRGHGSRLLDHIKGLGFELIELEANGSKPEQFFSANGFVHTGITRDWQSIMVWNNPEYVN